MQWAEEDDERVLPIWNANNTQRFLEQSSLCDLGLTGILKTRLVSFIILTRWGNSWEDLAVTFSQRTKIILRVKRNNIWNFLKQNNQRISTEGEAVRKKSRSIFLNEAKKAADFPRWQIVIAQKELRHSRLISVPKTAPRSSSRFASWVSPGVCCALGKK